MIDAQTIRREATPEQVAAGICWDPRNGLPIDAPYALGGRATENCHDGHHHPGVRDTRIPRTKLPPSALEFGRELLGERLEDYLRRRYR